MNNTEKAIRSVLKVLKKTKDWKNGLHPLCCKAIRKYGLPSAKSAYLMRAVGRRISSKPTKKWYTCCYRVVSPEGLYYDMPYVRESTSRKRIAHAPENVVMDNVITSVPLHAYQSKLQALSHLKRDYDVHVMNWKKSLERNNPNS